MTEKPKTFFAVSSEEAVKEGRLPLAFFEFREDAELYLNHALQTGIITEWMIDRSMGNQTKENLVAVAMRIVTDRLKAPALLESLRECAGYVKREIDSLVECQTHPGTGQIDPDDLAYINVERAILARAEAAIAKAEGR